ncbi:MAG TPA: hypothetical protein VFC29_16315 [Candidatus Limnocylindrales bacterium]|nr:hypothetical protein [Candidatus Limnocylindrales bacterium]
MKLCRPGIEQALAITSNILALREAYGRKNQSGDCDNFLDASPPA